MNLKAHQDAAAFINERDGTNLSTREIQSITWEQIRTLFQPEQKREKASYAKKGDKETVLDESRQIWDKTTDDGEAREIIEEDLEAMASQTGPHQGSCALLLKMWPTQKKFDSSDFLRVLHPDCPIPTPAEILTDLVPPELLD